MNSKLCHLVFYGKTYDHALEFRNGHHLYIVLIKFEHRGKRATRRSGFFISELVDRVRTDLAVISNKMLQQKYIYIEVLGTCEFHCSIGKEDLAKVPGC